MGNQKIRKMLYWIISVTWGGLLTIPGLIVTGICVLLGGKPVKNGYSYIVKIGKYWGGLEFGAVSLCEDDEGFEHLRRHEYGHSIQNLIWGPFYIPCIWIPSIIRYHYRNVKTAQGYFNPPYDSIWFEGQATRWGTKEIDRLESLNK